MDTVTNDYFGEIDWEVGDFIKSIQAALDKQIEEFLKYDEMRYKNEEQFLAEGDLT